MYKFLRHTAIFGALDSLNPGETMRFCNDHDLLAQIGRYFGPRVKVAYVARKPRQIVIDFFIPA